MTEQDDREPDPWAAPDRAPASAVPGSGSGWAQPGDSRPGGNGQPGPWQHQPVAWEHQPGPWQHQHQPWDLAPPPDPAAKRRKRRLAVASLVGVVGLLIATLGAATVYEDRREARVREQVSALLPGLQEFVAAERGLPFLQPVDVEVLGDDEFLDALYEVPDGAPEPREDRDPEPTLKALGLLEGDADLDEEVTDSLDAGVVGFYDAATDRLVVRGRSVDPFVELVIVHELVHALQDQHFDIDRPELDEADDERGTAFSALVEGDATRVEQAWYAAQSPERQRDIERSFASPTSGSSDVVEELLGFPYYAGPGYVDAVLARGGQDELDALFGQPPTTTAEVLRPGRPPAVDDVARPEPDGDVVDEGVLGLLGLHLLLGYDPLELGGAVDGWSGDRYVTVTDDDRTCTVAHIAVGSRQLRAELTEELRDWAASQPDAEVGPGPEGTVRLQSCLG